MKAIRILLILFITYILLLMVGCPGLYDSKRRFSSRRHLSDADRQNVFARTSDTQKAVEAARLEVEEANRLDRRDILIFEAVMLPILGVSVYAFIRVGKSGGPDVD